MEILDLTNRKGLVIGIVNEHSLTWAAAQHYRNAGTELAITYLNDNAKPFVEPLARQSEAGIFLPYNVEVPVQLEAVFEPLVEEGGSLTTLSYYGAEKVVDHYNAWGRRKQPSRPRCAISYMSSDPRKSVLT